MAPTIPGAEPYRDGLTFPPVLDRNALALQRLLQGRGRPDKLLERAYNMFRSDSTRTLYDAVLLTTCDIEKTSIILKGTIELTRVYSECFFDITVFEGEADKTVFLDRVAILDPAAAQIMRNVMAMGPTQLQVLSDHTNLTRVDPKTALEDGLTLYATLFKLFFEPALQFEPLIVDDPRGRERFDWLFKNANTCAGKVIQFSQLLLQYELDKSAENFLSEFMLKLNQPPIDLITDGDPDTEII